MIKLFTHVSCNPTLIAILFAFNCYLFTINFCSAQWIQTNDSNDDVQCLAASGDTIFAGTYGRGLLISTNNGTSWLPLNNGLKDSNIVNSIICLAKSGKKILAGTNYRGLFLSTNNGTSWFSVDNGNVKGSSSLAISGNNIFAGNNDFGVFISTNNGAIWTAVNNGLKDTIISALAVMGKYIFTGTYEGGIYISSDNGASWNFTGLQNYSVSPLAISGENIFAGDDRGGIYLSTNNGASWDAVNKGLPNYPDFVVQSFVVSGTNIFAGIAGGVYLSTNNGTNWNDISNGLPDRQVWSLTISGNYIFAGLGGGTDSLGIWKRPLWEVITDINELRITNYELRIYPNPTSDMLNFEFNFTNQQLIKSINIQIYNLEGQKEIEKLITLNKEQIDVSNLQEGINFIKITNDKTVKIAKFIKE